MAATQPIRNKQQVRALAGYYLRKGQLRNYALVTLGLHTALRISDLLRLRWEDVYDFDTGCVRESIALIEKKTGKPKIIALHKSVVKALAAYAAKVAATCLRLNTLAQRSYPGEPLAFMLFSISMSNLGCVGSALRTEAVPASPAIRLPSIRSRIADSV